MFIWTCFFVWICSNGYSEGSPWDWQNSNVKYPVFDQDLYSKSGQTTAIPENPLTLRVHPNVTAFVGESAYLPCRVQNLGEHTVSWLRGRDTSVLSVGHLTFSSDARFRVLHIPRPRLHAADWSLEIKDVSLRDGGWYDCQVNTEPKVSNKSYLTVTKEATKSSSSWSSSSSSKERIGVSLGDSPDIQPRGISEYLGEPAVPRAVISGPRALSIRVGESVALECSISPLKTPPLNLYWRHKNRVITPKSRQGISLENEKSSGVSRSKLVIQDVRSEDGGVYSCVTDVAAPTSIELIVVDDDGAEALASRAYETFIISAGVTLIFPFAVILGEVRSYL